MEKFVDSLFRGVGGDAVISKPCPHYVPEIVKNSLFSVRSGALYAQPKNSFAEVQKTPRTAAISGRNT